MTLTTFSDTTNVGEDFIQHYGTKGMKWGVRKDLKKLPTKKAREAYVAEKDAKWRAKTEDPKKAIRAAKRASRDATRMTRKLNKKYKDMGYKLKGNSLRKNNINNRKNRLVRNQYDIELKGIIESSLDSAAYRVYKNSPSRLYQVNLSRDLDGTVSAKITPRQNAKLDKQRASITNKARKMKHSDEGTQDLYVKMEEDEDGFVVDIQLPEFDLEFAEDEVALDHSDLSDLGSGFIQHYGVKGMKWGKRKAEDEVKTTASKSKYGTSTTNADGTTEMYVGGVGTVGKHLTEEEQAEVDELAKVVQELGDKSNAMIPEINELEMEESKLKQTAKTPEEKKRLSEVTTKREALSDKLSAIMDEYSPKALRYNELAAKANKADAEYYKTHPDERRKANIKPKFGTTTYTIQKPKPAGPDEARFKKKIKHSNSQNGIYSSDLSELGSDFLQHYGVKGMKWGVRKDSKPRGYQGSSSTKKKVKKAVSDAVDPDKRAKRKLQKAKSKYERQRLIEQASGYEKAAEESKKNSRENEASSDPKPKSKSVKDLSDDDLNKIIRRIELERRYSTLMEQQRPKSTTEKVNKFLKKAATEAAENVAKQLITKGIGAAVTRATGVPVNGANAKAATNALKTAANDATNDVTKAAQKQAATQPPKGNTETNSPKAPHTPFTRAPMAPTKSKNVFNAASPTKSPSFSDILSKSYNDTITSGTTQRGNSWLDEFDTNRDFVTLNGERRKRR